MINASGSINRFLRQGCIALAAQIYSPFTMAKVFPVSIIEANKTDREMGRDRDRQTERWVGIETDRHREG